MKTDIIVVVWGEEYTRLMTSYFFPSLLSPGNLPAWPHLKKTKLIIYTTPQDWKTIKKYRKIFAAVAVEFKEINPADGDPHSPHLLMNKIHGAALAWAKERGHAILPLCPDIIISDGSLKRLAALIDAGNNLVVLNGLRIRYQGIESILRAYKSPDSKTCVDLFAEYMHPMAANQFWNSRYFTRLPSNLFYWDGEKTIIGRCAHLHPFFIREPFFGEDFSTIDGHYINQFDGQRDRVHIVRDNSICVLSLTPDSHNDFCRRHGPGDPTPLIERQTAVKHFLQSWLPIHRWFYEQELRFTGWHFKAKDIQSNIDFVDGIGISVSCDPPTPEGDTVVTRLASGEYRAT